MPQRLLMRIGLAGVCVIGSAASGTASAQLIPDRPACATCQITPELQVVLGAVDGEAALANVLRVRVDGRGRYWILSDAMPMVFDERGAFIRTVGTMGTGPGELQGPTDVWMLPADSVLIRDSGLTIHLFDPDLRYVRTLRSPVLGIQDAIVLSWPTNIVVNALDPTPARFGYPFHMVSFANMAGEVLRSYGATNETITPSTIYSVLPHALNESSTGGFWSIAGGMYDIAKWSGLAELEYTLRRRPQWFSDRSDMSPGGPEMPPSPRCLGVSEDEARLLWSFCLVPSPRYKQAWGRVADRLKNAGTVEIPSGEIDYEYLYDTQVETIDPKSQRVIATHYLQGRVVGVLPDRRAALLVQSPAGVPYVHIYRFRLDR